MQRRRARGGAREDWTLLAVRVPRKLREQLREYVKRIGYLDTSEWLRDVIRSALQVQPAPPEYLVNPPVRERELRGAEKKRGRKREGGERVS